MKLKLVLVSALLAIPGAALTGMAAYADPSGCSASTTDFGLDSGKKLQATGEGLCSTSASRNLQVEIKQDLSLQPDPVVAHGNDSRTAKSYASTVVSCDNGNTATYYGRTFFTTNTTYHDSTHRRYTVC
ncbi:hypothetical protein [Micromonospora sp. RP3T]|uniref:hypothetical protein n=1 Tax=Micromonospora sp. RP3T TaxID=2135446 RepID=UPI000D16AD06|nr:hypothetical protein [Micromonospora sp. RP3T]PTA44017.1 hypothetical protein C8054_22060 [Micromonospora sp. RP3T]